MYNKYNNADAAMGCGHAQERYNRFGKWGYRRPKHNVPVNIIENDTHFEAHIYALGFAKENTKISVVGDELYITGTRDVETEPNFVLQEYPIKSFERVLNLNGKVDTAAISATHENGILKISMPKTPAAQKAEQEIKVN